MPKLTQAMLQSDNAFTEFLRISTRDELEAGRKLLVEVIMDIDGNLSRGRIDDDGNFRMPLSEYNVWHRRTVDAKNHRQRQLLAVKARLAEANREAYESAKGVRTQRVGTLLRYMHEIIETPELAVLIAKRALLEAGEEADPDGR